MRVKCISTYPNENQIQSLGPGFSRNHDSYVTIGREYLVLGLTVNVASQDMGNGAWVDILMEPDIPTVISEPLCLFEIIDARVSRYWEIRVVSDGSITLEPSAFSRKSFLEDVSDRVTEAVDEFWCIHALLEEEAKGIFQTGEAG